MILTVDTAELQTAAGTVDGIAADLAAARIALAQVVGDDVPRWCLHPGAAAALRSALEALEETARDGWEVAGLVVAQLTSAAQGYLDADTPQPR